MSTSTPQDTQATTPVRHEMYIPGYALPKLGLALMGLIMLTVAFYQARTFLWLGFTGRSTMAESVHISLVDAAGTVTVLRDDAEVALKEDELKKSKDRSLVFWIDYRFSTKDGAVVIARSPLGQVMKPLHTLKDEDGLPRSITLWYDPAHPQTIVIPPQFLRASGAFIPFGLNTIFVPSMLLIFGITGLFVGLLLWWNAKKPIEMPDLSASHGEATRRMPTAGH